jgi:hypothetical protein
MAWRDDAEEERRSSRRVVLRAGRHRPRQSQEQASMIRQYIIWRNNHAFDETIPPYRRQGKRRLMRH